MTGICYFNQCLMNTSNPSSVVSTPISAATLLPSDTVRATSIDKDAPSPSISPNIKTSNLPINSTNVKPNEEIVEFDSETFTNPFAPSDTSSAESSSKFVDVIIEDYIYVEYVLGGSSCK
ncbi:hypothetical protein Tco_0880946 [Tanacetum coccineum]